MMTDETPLDNENGGDSETIVLQPLTSNQKKVIQKILFLKSFILQQRKIKQ